MWCRWLVLWCGVSALLQPRGPFFARRPAPARPRARAAAVAASAARDRVAQMVRAGRFDPFAALGLSAAKRQSVAEVTRAFNGAVRAYDAAASAGAAPDAAALQAAVDAHDLLQGGQDAVDAWRDVVRDIARGRAVAADMSANRDRVAAAARAGRFEPFAFRDGLGDEAEAPSPSGSSRSARSAWARRPGRRSMR